MTRELAGSKGAQAQAGSAQVCKQKACDLLQKLMIATIAIVFVDVPTRKRLMVA